MAGLNFEDFLGGLIWWFFSQGKEGQTVRLEYVFLLPFFKKK